MTPAAIQQLRRRDVRHLWHPYTEMSAFEAAPFPIIEKAKGVYLYEKDGRALLDGISSWWCVNLGHGHPRLVAAIQKQAEELQHCILGGISHPRAIELAEQLAKLAPKNLNHVFFAGDGSCAVEAALKIAIQYWTNIGKKGRTRFICLADGYHGDTLGAIGVGYVETFHKNFKPVIHQAHRACSPHCAQCPFGKKPESCDVECSGSMRQLIQKHHQETAAVILEPLCQGAAGVRIYPAEYLRRVRQWCDEYGLLLIADEIAVGFGRTGTLFACQQAGVSPDIMCIGKGLTGGYLPMSAALVTDSVYDTFRKRGDEVRTFFHGHTFCGNPITSALALAVLEVYREENILEKIKPRVRQFEKRFPQLKELLTDANISTLGMIGAIELSESIGGAKRAQQIARRAVELGLFIRPLGPVIYLWPPLVTSQKELEQMFSILEAAIRETA